MTMTPPLTAARTSTRPRLFTPGPVEIPVRILRALSQVPPHHRTEVFRETYKRVMARDYGTTERALRTCEALLRIHQPTADREADRALIARMLAEETVG